MIKVNLEDFEKFRSNLLRYASGLLRTRGFGNHKVNELDELAKDIVQETYFRFHRHYKDAFVSELHLENFIKICLYRVYQETIDSRRRGVQYILLKKGDFDRLNINDHPFTRLDGEEYDTIIEFKKTLNNNQLEILDKLLEGFNMFEIAKEREVSRQCIHDHVSKIKIKYEKFNKL
jgi:DNA-directed RNA polymerase specialized sigma24 family protein